MRRALAALIVVAALAGCGTPSVAAGGDQATATPKRTAKALAAGDVTITIKVTSKQCFGSAGCNVEYDVKPNLSQALRPLLEDDDYDVTYTVTGFTEGPQIGTLTLTGPDTYERDSFMFGSTPSSKTKLIAKVTEVERS